MDVLGAMRLFTKVVETGSFSETARRLDLDQSSVSRQIGALEDRLGVRLLNRTTRRLNLTEAGRLYYERAGAIVAEVEDADAAVSQLSGSPRGVLRINAPVVFGRLQLAPALPKFLGRYPEVKIDLTLTDHYVDLIEEGSDVAIRMGEPRPSSLIARKLADNPWAICGSPDYLERSGSPATPEDLVAHNCLTRRPQAGGTFVWQFEGADGRHEVAVSGNLRTNNSEILRAAAIGGMGLVRLSEWIVRPEIRAGSLRLVLEDYEVSPMGSEGPIYAVFPHSRHVSAKVRAFVDFMAERLQPHAHHPTPAG